MYYDLIVCIIHFPLKCYLVLSSSILIDDDEQCTQNDIMMAEGTTGCFSASNDQRDWFNAKQTCTRYGGVLAQIPDARTHQSLSEALGSSGSDFWIGHTNRLWLDGHGKEHTGYS